MRHPPSGRNRNPECTLRRVSPTEEFNWEAIEKIANQLMRTAIEISPGMGYHLQDTIKALA